MPDTQFDDVIYRLKSLSDDKVTKEMERVGINTDQAYGISIYALQRLAKEMGRDHALAQQLWESGLREARILAGMTDNPEMVTETQMESWVKDFDSWDVCDLCCGNLFDKTPFAYQKAEAWSQREEEFVKRAGFVLMAALAVHDKAATDEELSKFMPLIKREATDGRNFVKKAVNWALRQIGKRNLNLNRIAVETAHEIRQIDSKSAHWIAADSIRELTGEAVQKRLRINKTEVGVIGGI